MFAFDHIPIALVFLIITITAQLFRHFVIAVASVVVHIVPEVNRNAFVTLAYVMIPQAWKVQHVTGIHSDFVGGSIGVLRVPLKVRFQRIDTNPLDEPRFAYFCKK